MSKTTKATKAKPVADLFGGAKVKKSATAAKEQKEIILVDDKAVAKALADYEQAKKNLDAATAAKAQAEGIIKPYAQKHFIEKYEKNGKRPDSFIVSNETGNSLLYITMDSYKKIDEERHTYLSDTYGEDIVEDNSIYTMNAEMVQKYGQEISEAIMNSKKIPDADKGSIIEKIESYSVKKGTIDKLKDFATKTKTSIATLFAEIIPTTQLKARGKE